MGSLSVMHWVVVAIVVVLLFGTRKLPELGSGLGQAINNFRNAVNKSGQIPEKTDTKKDEDSKA